jgi:hypothetical protein
MSPGSPTLAVKLGIREGSTLAIVNEPEVFPLDIPGGVEVLRRARPKTDVVLAFFKKRSDLERRIASLEKSIYPAGALWVAWPKRSSGVETDMTDHAVREIALLDGLVDNKVCAIDETWTGLRLVWRLEHRPPT